MIKTNISEELRNIHFPSLNSSVLVVFIACILLGPHVGLAQDNPMEGFDEWVQQGIDLWKTPGLAVAVVHNGEVTFQRGFGVTEVGSRDSVDVETLFANASTTKAFASMAIAMLVDDGKLEWSDRVVDHIPEFRVSDPDRTMDIRIIDMLSHRTGVTPTNPGAWGISQEDGLYKLKFAEASSPIRSQFEYNNDMYILAGKLVERVSGFSWEEFLQARILDPLSMTATRAYASEFESLPNRAMPHFLHQEKLVPYKYGPETSKKRFGAAGAMVSNVDEMSKWLRFLLNKGKIGDEYLISKQNFSMLFTPHISLPQPLYPAATTANSNLFAYGLGWFLQDYRGQKMIMHTGSIPGMIALAGLLPEEDVGVVVFGNRDHVELRHAIMYEVFDRHLGIHEKNWNEDLYELYSDLRNQQEARRDSLNSLREMNSSPSSPIEQYAGSYFHNIYEEVEIEIKDDTLRIRGEHTSTWDGWLEHWHHNVFKWHFDFEPYDRYRYMVEFDMDAMNRIESMNIRSMRYAFHGPFVKER